MNLAKIMFWPNLVRDIVLIALGLTPLIVLQWEAWDIEGFYPLMCWSVVVGSGLFLLLMFRRWRNPFRLYKRGRHFHTVASPNIVLCYEPILEGTWNSAMFHGRCEETFAECVQRFAFTLPRQVAIFVFASHEEISRIFRRSIGGSALSRANAIVVGNDTNLEEAIRHEMAHLFSARWNPNAPPFLKEGIATHLQAQWSGTAIDTKAMNLIRSGTQGLPFLLRPSRALFVPKKDRHSLYILGASFTGFLIRRFGWETYRKFFRATHVFNVRRSFRKVFGVALSEAETHWRNELGC